MAYANIVIKNRVFSDIDALFLRKNALNYTISELTELFHGKYTKEQLTNKLINDKIPYKKIRSQNVYWHDQDIKFLIRNHAIYTIRELEEGLGYRFKTKEIKSKLDQLKLNYKKLSSVERGEITRNYHIIHPDKQKIFIPVNHDFFKVWSSEMAYIFGLWCADGNIWTDGRCHSFKIGLHERDEKLLIKILNAMDSKHKLHKRKNFSLISIGSKTIYRDIVRLGGTPNKSLTLTFPDIPSQFISDFLRGYFDGDGCLSKTKGKMKGTLCFLGTKEFLEKVRHILVLECDVNYNKIREHKKSNIFSLAYGGRHNLQRISNYLYKDNPSLFLKRKRYIFNLICGDK